MRHLIPLSIVVCAAGLWASSSADAAAIPRLRKVTDVVIYHDTNFYSAFPSVVRTTAGELILAFRRAPERRLMGGGVSHTDANSYLVLTRSRDDGKSWGPVETIFAHPFGGSQDPCLVQLRDGSLLCASYGWAQLPLSYAKTLSSTMRHGEYAFLGGYVMRSTDGGKHWTGPIIPPHVEADKTLDAFGRPTAAYNRGSMCQGADGRLYWAVAVNSAPDDRRAQTHLLISSDAGTSWQYSCPIAADDKAAFNETSLYETPKGDLVAFMRTANFDDHTAVARSTNRGLSFEKWEDAGFQGHPHCAVRLPGDHVLLVYGYRHKPYGVRARILDPECSTFTNTEEIVIRDDGGNGDLGYPWATMLSGKRVLVVYYFNTKDETRHIAGTILEIEN